MTAAPDLVLDCPACGTAEPQALRFRKHGFDIRQCRRCGLGRAEAPGFDPHAYYTGDYFNGGHSDGYTDYRGSEAVLRQEFRRTLDSVVAATGIRGGRLLEVGCAYGFFLAEARRRFEVHGVELAADAVAFCHRQGLDTVRHGEVDRAFLAERGPFDLIVMLDVIEHLTDPRAVMAMLAEHLVAGGALVLTTGDFASLAARLTGAGWRLMTPPQHLWYFTPASLRGLARQTGLEVAEVTHPGKTVPLSLIAFQIARMLGARPPRLPAAFSRMGLPINLFDAMRVILKKPGAPRDGDA